MLVGRNKIVLNQATMKLIVAEYLNSRFLGPNVKCTLISYDNNVFTCDIQEEDPGQARVEKKTHR